jgi:hypothetical protein
MKPAIRVSEEVKLQVMILPAIKVTRQKKIPLFQEYFKAC